MSGRPRIALVGDYEGVQASAPAIESLRERADVTVFGDPIAADQVAVTLADYPIVIAIRERTPFPAEVLAELPALELISQSGTHAAHVDLEAAARQGIAVACGPATPGKTRESLMPELVFGMLLGLARDLVPLQQGMRAGGWPSSVGRSVRGWTLGILGLGRHGKAVAAVAKLLGMRVIAWGPTLDHARAADHGVEFVEDLDDLLPQVDVLSVHLKLSDLSRGLLDARRLDLLPSQAIIINTARGAIIDEAAMAERLADGRLGGAGLDVFTTEPLPADNPLRGLDNVILTPHVGWIVDQNLQEFSEDTAGHVQAYLDGRLPRSTLLEPSATEVDRPRLGDFSG
jgi:phosphoglycerate dehydrogenase-like enzyme